MPPVAEWLLEEEFAVGHENVAEPSVNGPRLFTARYLAEGVLTGGKVVPVRIPMHPPLISLPYELEETAWLLVREPWMAGEWPWLSPTFLGLPRLPGRSEDREGA